MIDLNRPKSLNAFNNQLFEDIKTAFDWVNDTSADVRVVILAGKGRSFSAGLDLKEINSMFPYESKSDVARRAIFIKKLLKK